MAALAALALVYWGRTKQMTKWIGYTGSDEQIEEIQKSKHGVMTEDFIIIDGGAPLRDLLCIGDKYLICQPHPYADEIKIWADTGCMIYVREPIDYAMTGDMYKDYATAQPNWNIPNAEYRLTPFED